MTPLSCLALIAAASACPVIAVPWNGAKCRCSFVDVGHRSRRRLCPQPSGAHDIGRQAHQHFRKRTSPRWRHREGTHLHHGVPNGKGVVAGKSIEEKVSSLNYKNLKFQFNRAVRSKLPKAARSIRHLRGDPGAQLPASALYNCTAAVSSPSCA
jgi:hypothetical protein